MQVPIDYRLREARRGQVGLPAEVHGEGVAQHLERPTRGQAPPILRAQLLVALGEPADTSPLVMGRRRCKLAPGKLGGRYSSTRLQAPPARTPGRAPCSQGKPVSSISSIGIQ